MSSPRIFLLDIMPLVFRAYFATLGKHISTGEGVPTGATLGFYNYIFQIIFTEKPDFIIAAQDSAPEERLAIESSYKSNRAESPEDLEIAIDHAYRLLECLNIPVLVYPGAEADDVIGSMVKLFEGKGDVFIVSPDKDFAQLVNEHVFLLRPAYKGNEFNLLGVEGVIEKFGVPPSQIPDLLALMGDQVDNIAGIPGVGEKTAAKILAATGSVSGIYDGPYLDSLKAGKLKENLIAFKEQTFRSRQLAVIRQDLMMEEIPGEYDLSDVDGDCLYDLLEELEFRQLKERLEEKKILSGRKLPEAEKLKYVSEIDELPSGSELGLEIISAKEHSFLIASGNVLYQPKNESEILELVSKSKVVVVSNAKALFKASPGLKIYIDKIHDIRIAEYILNPDKTIDEDHLFRKYKIAAQTDLFENAGQFLNKFADIYSMQVEGIKDLELAELFRNVEMPLTIALADMEDAGIKVSTELLEETANELKREIALIEKEIYQLAGYEFNINSTAQTGELLQKFFGAGLRKTKTGKISSTEKVLDSLKGELPLAELIIRYRKLNKLLSTYVEALPKYIDRTSGRIHAHFSQTTAGTGRLSCTEPNLQNLPIKTELGRVIRKAVVAEDGNILLAADYSQVELRLLAVLSGDKALIEAFRLNKDIHTITAASILKVPIGDVTEEMRNVAKGVNFGIVYGITPFGLSDRLKISQTEAKEFIENYFLSFPDVKKFQEQTLEFARVHGYTRTATGRIRFIEGINSRNGTNRRNAERVALNAPIQGLAADLIKIAMINSHKRLIEEIPEARMVLQVHDELVFELPEHLYPSVSLLVKDSMENALDLKVPLKVEIGHGKNWLDLEYDS